MRSESGRVSVLSTTWSPARPGSGGVVTVGVAVAVVVLAVACLSVPVAALASDDPGVGTGTDLRTTDSEGVVGSTDERGTYRNETVEGVSAGDPTHFAPITADRRIDEGPAVAATGDGYLAVWRRHAEGKRLNQGRDVFWSLYRDGEWTDPAPITDDLRFDASVDVAYDPDRDRAIAVWNKLMVTFEEGEEVTYERTVEEADRTEIFYAVYEDGSWSEPHRATDNDRVDVGPRVVEDDGDFHLAWERHDEGYVGSFELRYGRIGSGGVEDVRTRSIPTGNLDVSGASEGGIRATYFEPGDDGGRNGTVVVLESDDGTLTRTDSYEVAGWAGSELTTREVVWHTNRDNESTVYYASDGTVAEVPLDREFDEINEVRATATGDRTALTYRAVVPGNATPRVFYTTRGDRWGVEAQLNETVADGFDFRRFRLAANHRDLGLVFLATESDRPEQNADVVGLVRGFHSDLRVEADDPGDGPREVGTEVTVPYSVRNRGDLPVEQGVGIEATADGEVLASDRLPELAPGERTNGTFTVEVPGSGRVTVRADPGGELPEFSTDDNAATVVLAGPDLGVTDVSATRDGGSMSIAVTVRNVGTVASGPFEVDLRDGEETITTRSGDGVAPGEDRTVEFELAVEDLPDRPVTVVANAPDDVNDRNDISGIDPFEPRIDLVGNQVEFRRENGSLVADVYVTNEGYGGAEFPIEARLDGDTVGAANASIAAATGEGRFASAVVPVELPESVLGEDVTLVADLGQGTPGDSVRISVPAAPADDEPPRIETFEVTAEDGTLSIRIAASEQLDPDSLRVSVTGPETTTLSGDRFESKDGTEFSATLQVDAGGEYTVELVTATDRGGNEVEDPPSGSAQVEIDETGDDPDPVEGSTGVLPWILGALGVLLVVGGVVYWRIRE